MNLGVTKQIGDDAAATLSEEDLAKALKAADGSLSLDISGLEKNEEESDRYMLVMKPDGSTKLEKIPEDNGDIVTLDAGCVPLAVFSVAGVNQTETSCRIHFIALFLAAILIALAMVLRKAHHRGMQILLILGNILLIALAILAIAKYHCFWDLVIFGVTAVLSVILILLTRRSETAE